MGIALRSPYRGGLPWIKGNLHAHTTNSDGPFSPQDTIDAYAARGYGFLMLSDHDQITDASGLVSRGMVLIPGSEITAEGPHLLHVNAQRVVAPVADRQSVIDAIQSSGGFAIACHPNWEAGFNHCPQERLESWRGYTGIEVYNGVIDWLPGSPLASDRWDRLLAQGRRVWGYANDDCHIPDDIGVAWNMVQAAPGNAGDILAALFEGRFYASTGVTIDRIDVNGRTVQVVTENAQRIIAFTDYARRLSFADGPELSYTVPDDVAGSYIRIECWGQGQQMAWAQPIFIERG